METRSEEELQKKASAIMALAENFQHELSDRLLKIWLRNLDPWPANIVENAVAMVLRNYKGWKFPSYSVLQSALDELCGKSQAQLRDQAIAEWGLLMRNISLRGTRNEPEHHPTTAYVIRLLGGWANVCQWARKRKRFGQVRHHIFKEGGDHGVSFDGRSERIRTFDPLLPKQVRFQAAPRSVTGSWRPSRHPGQSYVQGYTLHA